MHAQANVRVYFSCKMERLCLADHDLCGEAEVEPKEEPCHMSQKWDPSADQIKNGTPMQIRSGLTVFIYRKQSPTETACEGIANNM